VYEKLPEHILQQIKDGLSIVDVIGRYVELKRAGRSHKGLCPFHGENAPSFNVSEERGFFYCFGCNASGDVIRFLQLMENLSFMEAVEMAAQQAGIELPKVKQLTVEEKRKLSEKDRFYEANRLAMEFYQEQLLRHPQKGVAQDYLARRGLSKAMVDRFQLGFAPESWDALTTAMERKGVPAVILEKVGLVAPGKRGSYYDRFRNRLIFPIIMQHERVVGFGGRTLADEDAKYINSPESPIYSKSASVYGYHAARAAIVRRNRAVIVEGNIDAVMMHQYGFEETIASLGTALTEKQIQFLKRMTTNLCIVYDGDAAGQKAMFRSLELFLKEKIGAKAIALPQGHDPDSFLRDQGAPAMAALLDNAPYLFDLWLEAQYAHMSPGPKGIAERLHGIVPMLAMIPDAVERELYVQRIAQRLGVTQALVLQMLRQHATQRNWESVPAETVIRAGRVGAANSTDAAEEELTALLLHFPDLAGEWFERDGVTAKMRDNVMRQTAERLLEGRRAGETVDPSALLEELSDPDGKNKVAKLILSERKLDEEVVARAYGDCVNVLAIRAFEERIAAIRARLRESSAGDAGEKARLAEELVGLYREQESLKRKRETARGQ